MLMHVVGKQNSGFYEHELRQNFKNRNEVFVKKRGWKDLDRPDGLEIDSFDNDDAVHLMMLRDDNNVIAGFRMHGYHAPNLLTDVFPHLLERPLPTTHLESMMDCTRFYSLQRGESAPERGKLTAMLFAAMMEYGLEEGTDFITFVTYPHFVNLMVSLGIFIMPLGQPQKIDRWPTLAAYMRVNEQTLLGLRKITGIDKPLLVARGARSLPSIHPQPLPRSLPPLTERGVGTQQAIGHV